MKKKIIIFTSEGGGGHLSVSNAIKALCENQYHVETPLLLSDILRSVDPMKALTLNMINSESWYNILLKRQHIALANMFSSIGLVYFKLRKQKIISLLDSYIQQTRPDCIVSVAPIFNAHILAVAEKYTIPFIIVPTDLNMGLFVNGLVKPTYAKLRITHPFPDPMIVSQLINKQIHPELCIPTGYPIRPAFTAPSSRFQLKDEFGIPRELPCVTLLMGAQGSSKIITFFNELIRLQTPVNLIICLGRNEELRTTLNQIPLPEHIKVTLFGFTDRMHDILAMTDILITKSGSSSVSEAIATNTPMILDGTGPVLSWERLNHDFIEKNGLGISLKDIRLVAPTIEEWLTTGKHQSIRATLEQMPKMNGSIEVSRLIDQILQ